MPEAVLLDELRNKFQARINELDTEIRIAVDNELVFRERDQRRRRQEVLLLAALIGIELDEGA